MKKFLSSYPELVKEWHPTKNGELTPSDFTHGSHEKVWWLCPKEHEYESVIKNRTNGTGCPSCSGKKPSKENNLLILFPKVANEWHPTKNDDKSPKDFTHGSGQKVWWLCPKGHSYESSINKRTGDHQACPYCLGKYPTKENNLLVLFPDVAKEWHPTNNLYLTPKDFLSKSSTKVWWKCKKGHDWEATISHRTNTKRPTGCPSCSGKIPSKENNLLILFPEIAKEWHPTKNKSDLPVHFTRGSEKKIWWLCPRGHEYKAIINSRTKGTCCPYCSRQSSQPEIRILTELKYLFKEVTSRYKVEGVEIDIFVPKYNLGIEYDGHYFHKNKKEKDLVKNKFLESKDITLIRIRESPLEKLSSNDLTVKNRELTKKDLNRLIHQMNLSVNDINIHVGDYLKLTDFVNTRMFNEFISCFPSPFPDLSLFNTHPDLSKEWDYESNYPLTPEDFSYGSDKKIWWKCQSGHKYESEVSRRARKENPTGCPFCSGRNPTKENNLLILFPEVTKEWHPTKNGDLVPQGFTGRSHKKVWWKCKKGHEYESIISNRTKSEKPTGCPSCSGKKPSKENNLLILFPQVAKEWHPTKNGELTPQNFTYGSSEKVWWKCKKGHEWESIISNRTKQEHPRGCPYCSGRNPTKENNLLILFPEVTKEWHPTKNGDLVPQGFTGRSNKKVWWKCKKGHEWESTISNRTSGTGCPSCSGRKPSKENNLLILFPKVAKEWHPTKNGELTPEDFTHGSGKKVWWECKRSHKWEAKIHKRTRKNKPTGCPYCSGRKKIEE